MFELPQARAAGCRTGLPRPLPLIPETAAMLRSVKDLGDYAIRATDGDIGHVRDFFFDETAWVIRYLVVDTGSWLLSVAPLEACALEIISPEA